MQHLDSTARASESQIPGTLCTIPLIPGPARQVPAKLRCKLHVCLSAQCSHSNRSGSTTTVPVLPSGEANGFLWFHSKHLPRDGTAWRAAYLSLEPTHNKPATIHPWLQRPFGSDKQNSPREKKKKRDQSNVSFAAHTNHYTARDSSIVFSRPTVLTDFKLVRRRRPQNWKFSAWPCMGLHRVLRVLHVETLPNYGFDAISTDPAFFMGGHVRLSLLNRLLSCPHLAFRQRRGSSRPGNQAHLGCARARTHPTQTYALIHSKKYET